MLTSHQRICPRWKEWKPLATQQYRLRNVIQIIGVNIGKTDLEGRSCGLRENYCHQQISYYYTLHLTAMSAPFYTSEKIQSNCPKWKEINPSTNFASNVFCGFPGFIFRLWSHDKQHDEVLLFWAVHLSGLMKFSTYLNFGEIPKAPNTILILMPGGYYINPSILNLLHTSRLTSLIVDKSNLRQSYSISHINQLNSAQKQVFEKTNETAAIKQKIINGEYLTSDTRGSATIRRLLNKNKPKNNHLDVAKLKESVEIAKFRLKLLYEEKARVLTKLSRSRQHLENIIDANQIKESRTMENYRLLQREVQAYREWLAGHYQRREAQLHGKTILNFRIQQLISELQFIYPIENHGNKFTICGVHLPDSENLTQCDDLQVSVGLGFVAHTVQMISIFLQVPLRYPVLHVGSRSCIVDFIVDQVPDNEREFPLYCKGKDKLQFNYAVYLLNKNIATLRWLCGLATHDLRSTLPNLSSILHLREADLPSVATPRSPASSAVDMTSPSFTVYSPVSSAFHARNVQRQRLSESSVDYPGGNSTTSFFHQDARFNFSRPLRKAESHSLTVSDPRMGSNFSYSLDKGLNEWEDMKRMAGPTKKATLSSSAQCGTLGSESNIQVSLANHESINNRTVDDVASAKFLQSWDWEKNYVIFSDDDSDQNSSCIFNEKTVSSIDRVVDNNTAPDGGLISLGVDVGNSSYYSCSPEKEHSSQRSATVVGVDVVDNCEGVECVEDVEAVEVAGEDALLGNVTDRTEALANQTTSFNMFRSRFRSTLGGTT